MSKLLFQHNYATPDSLIAAYLKAGNTFSIDAMYVDCDGPLPSFSGSTYHAEDQLPNLARGRICLGDLDRVKTPEQAVRSATHEEALAFLADYTLAPIQLMWWLHQPENEQYIPESWKFGRTVFMTQYRAFGGDKPNFTDALHYSQSAEHWSRDGYSILWGLERNTYVAVLKKRQL